MIAPTHPHVLRDIRNAKAASEALARGASQASVAKSLGVSAPKLCRILRTYRKALENGVDVVEAFEPKRSNCGRKPDVVPGVDEVAALQRWMKLPAMSKSAAIRQLARDPVCSARVKGHILECVAAGKPFSAALMRACNVTFQAKEKAKGPKHAQYAKQERIRNGLEILPDGSERWVEPGDWWEFDDMSENHPFWYEVAPGEMSRKGRAEKALRKHNALVGRQGLYAMDVKGRWLGLELIGRSNDAYTAADVLRFMRRLMMEYGKPRRGIRLEQAIWKSNVITGNFAMTDGEREKLEIGLKALGLEVEYCVFSGQKGGIEGGFHLLQKEASLAFLERKWPDVGREAGDREASERKLRQAHEGVKHPKDLGFPHISELAAALGELMEARNLEWHDGRIQQGVPDVEWAKSLKAKPLARLTQDNMSVFMPYVTDVLTVGQEVVKHTVDGEEFRFVASDLLEMGLGKGAKVRVQFDPTDPGAGAVFHNATPKALCPPHIRPNQMLGWAPEQFIGPQFGGQYQKEPSKRRFKAFQAVYKTPSLFGVVGGVSAHEARDGRGNAVVVTNAECGVRSEEKPPCARAGAETGAPVAGRRNLAAEAAEAPARRARDRGEEIAERTSRQVASMDKRLERMEARRKALECV